MIMLVQLLCPERHCLVAAAYDDRSSSFLETCRQLEKLFQAHGLNRWCGICGSHELHHVESRTRYATMEEAAPRLAEEQLKQMLTRKVLDQAGQTYDQQRRN
jgi:hypothetical protein